MHRGLWVVWAVLVKVPTDCTEVIEFEISCVSIHLEIGQSSSHWQGSRVQILGNRLVV